MIEFYHSNTSICCQMVRMVLAEKDIEWTGHHLNIMKGEQKSPEYLKINPEGIVPALVHDGKIITESTVIAEYLEAVFPTPALLPDDPYKAARARLWTRIPDEYLFEACATLSFALALAEQMKKTLSPDQLEQRVANQKNPLRKDRLRDVFAKGAQSEHVARSAAQFERIFRKMESWLESNLWLGGDNYNLADIALLPYVERVDKLGLDEFWSNTRPCTTEWLNRMRALPSYEAAYTKFQPIDHNDNQQHNKDENWAKVQALLARYF